MHRSVLWLGLAAVSCSPTAPAETPDAQGPAASTAAEIDSSSDSTAAEPIAPPAVAPSAAPAIAPSAAPATAPSAAPATASVAAPATPEPDTDAERAAVAIGDAEELSALSAEAHKRLEAAADRAAVEAERQWPENQKQRVAHDDRRMALATLRGAWSELASVAISAAPAAPRCEVHFDKHLYQFMMGDTPVFFPIGPGVWGESLGASVLNVPQADDTLLVGLAGQGIEPYVIFQYEPMETGFDAIALALASSTLWRIDCAHPTARPQRYTQVDGADFGTAIASPDGKSLLFRRFDRLALLDLATRRVDDFKGGAGAVDVPAAWDERGLYYQQYEAEESCHGGPGPEMLALDPRLGRAPTDLAGAVHAIAIVALARAADDSLWLTLDGSDRPWRSVDLGRTWEALAPIGQDAADDAANDNRAPISASELLLDPQDAKKAITVSRSVAWSRAGNLFLTVDGGLHWRQLGDLADVTAIVSLDGGLDHLRVATSHERESMTLESSDGGVSWHPSATPLPPMAPPSSLALPGEVTLTVGAAGLWRGVAAKKPELVFPPPHAFMASHQPEVAPTPISWQQWDASLADNAKGVALARAKRFDDAIAAFQAAWTTNPNHVRARYNAACAHARAGRPAEAMALLETLSRLGGAAAINLLALARADADLASLAAVPRFKWLTTVDVRDTRSSLEEAFDIDSGLMLISDCSERLCAVLASGFTDEGDSLWTLHRFDCRSGRMAAPATLSDDMARQWLGDLAAQAWREVEAGTPEDLRARAAFAKRFRANDDVVVRASPFSQREVALLMRSEDGELGGIDKILSIH